MHPRPPRKIDPGRGALLGDGTPNDADRVEIGPTALAYAEWAEAGLALPDLPRMRRWRWERLTAAVATRDLAGLLLFDPLNIRYATDATNMQLWNTHNLFRAVLLCADGHMVLWEYRNAPFLAAHNPHIAEIRHGATFFYNSTGARTAAAAAAFAAEVDEIVRARAGTNRRLAVDKIMPAGLKALEALGFETSDGEEVTERTRAIKSADEIAAMRCAHHACERAVDEMRAALAPGISEDALWAHLHAGNIRRGGEWIETRLLASGPRTNPWFQECGPREVQPNEVVAFDTDLIGCYGMCIDISRSWWVGPGRPGNAVVSAMHHALDHLHGNMALLRPGVSLRDLTFGGPRLAPEYERQKYSVKMHGVGLCDEWPFVYYPDQWIEGAFDAVLEPGMVLCVEALVSPEGGDFSIKLEDQVLITETGHETLTRYPFDAALTGDAAAA